MFRAAAFGAESDLAASSVATGGLKPVDWGIIVIYAISTIVLGWWFGRRQTTRREYFVGSGNMNPILIGVSLFASLLSTITYLSIPGEMFGKGPVYLTNYLAYPFVFFVVGFVMLPIYMRHRVTSAYELLGQRLGGGVRLLGVFLFLALRLVWMSLLVYLTGKAIATMIVPADVVARSAEAKEAWISAKVPLIVLVTGLVSVTYASIGGLRAVVITDLIQTILLYGGAVLVIATVTWQMGGFDWFPTRWQEHWDAQPILPRDASTRVTMLGTLLSVFLWMVATSGGDQVSVQRFMATENAGTARRAIGMQLVVSMVVGVTLGLAGFALLGYFQAHPDQAPSGADLKKNADLVFPHFIAFHLPPVVSGLVVSGLFAAAMSSIDSGVNSITAVVTTDLVDPLSHRPMSEEKHVLMARVLAFVIGAVVVVCSSFMERVPGNITAVTMKTANLLTVPIFCLFFFALFVKFASPAGVWIGAVFGVGTAVSIAFSGPIFGFKTLPNGDEVDPVSFQWIMPAALVVNLAVGAVASLALPSRREGDKVGT
ncbi:MAG: sodium/solute symporter [Verrucomicrobiae bacterium]|nr:sodium/solute symporter [Verrucomicrobiae bacterium]